MKAVAAYKLHGEKDDSIHAHRYIMLPLSHEAICDDTDDSEDI